MNWEFSRILIDFGLLVLIWLVQLIIYPSFAFTNHQTFPSWHTRYSRRISYFVIPLMFAQVGIYGRSLFLNFQTSLFIADILIVAVWAITFIWIVPVHNSLGTEFQLEKAHKLVKLNWIRTSLWTMVFVLSLNNMSDQS